MMTRVLCVVLLSMGFVAQLVSSGGASAQLKTPEISGIEMADEHGELVFFMRAELGSTGTYVGAALICSKGDPDGPKVSVFLGGFPSDRRLVQLAVKRVDGSVERFGPVMSGGPSSGFHSPEIYHEGDVERFVQAALVKGALVSNGYNSFWNRVSDARNREVRELFLSCLGVGE